MIEKPGNSLLVCLEILKRNGYRTAVGVPGTLISPFIQLFDQDPDLEYIPAANEGNAVAIAAGLYLAGRRSVVIMQNSGIGNVINPYTSLCKLYEIPLLFIIGYRGYYPDAPQHTFMAQITEPLLELLRNDMLIFPQDVVDVKQELTTFLKKATTGNSSATILINTKFPMPSAGRGTNYEKSHASPRTLTELPSREEAIACIIKEMPAETLILSSVGIISKTLHKLRPSDSNFYSPGAMGHASSIALGVATAYPERPICILEGDGSFLMHLGGAAIVARSNATKIVHCVLDDQCYFSTGEQKTPLASERIHRIAEAMGYSFAVRVKSISQLQRSLTECWRFKTGPKFIQVAIEPTRDDNMQTKIYKELSPTERVRNFRKAIKTNF